jgi:hypothetical protein
MQMNRETIKRLLVVVVIVAIAGVIVAYSYYASHGIIEGPTIVVTSPAAGETSFATSSVTIKGVATRTQSITLNGRPILIDQAGNFLETIILFPGYNVETLSGVDKFGHTTTVSLPLVYTPK